jgi:hypothetical protein
MNKVLFFSSVTALLSILVIESPQAQWDYLPAPF